MDDYHIGAVEQHVEVGIGTVAAHRDIAESVGGAATQAIGARSAVSDSGAGRRMVTVTDTTSLTGANRNFLRVKIALR